MTSRKREYTPHLSTPREIVPEIFSEITQQHKVALVFGSEKYGLAIDELQKCNRLVTIAGNPDYFSLNLAQAVQILCYEIYSQYNSSLLHLEQTIKLASFADNQGVLNHLEYVLQLANYNNKDATRTRRRLQNILNKASLVREDVDLLRGMLKAIEGKLKNK
jgi:tRNA/rRNA methyltransferase